MASQVTPKIETRRVEVQKTTGRREEFTKVLLFAVGRQEDKLGQFVIGYISRSWPSFWL
jgi:hypothetical protein